MCHRMMTISRIDEPLNSLDLRHWEVIGVALYSGSMDKGSFFRSILETRALEEISTQNGPFNSNSNSMSSCVSQ